MAVVVVVWRLGKKARLLRGAKANKRIIAVMESRRVWVVMMVLRSKECANDAIFYLFGCRRRRRRRRGDFAFLQWSERKSPKKKCETKARLQQLTSPTDFPSVFDVTETLYIIEDNNTYARDC